MRRDVTGVLSIMVVSPFRPGWTKAQEIQANIPSLDQRKVFGEGFVGSVDPGSALPAEPIALDMNDPAQHAPVLHTRLAPRLRRQWPQPLDLFVCQPELPAYPASQSRAAWIGWAALKLKP